MNVRPSWVREQNPGIYYEILVHRSSSHLWQQTSINFWNGINVKVLQIYRSFIIRITEILKRKFFKVFIKNVFYGDIVILVGDLRLFFFNRRG